MNKSYFVLYVQHLILMYNKCDYSVEMLTIKPFFREFSRIFNYLSLSTKGGRVEEIFSCLCMTQS